MHAVVRTDRMYATDNRSGLVSVRFKPNGVATEIDNGNVVRLGALESHDTREVFVGEIPSASDKLGDIALIASTEVMYSKRDRDLSDFYNKAGNLSRGYRLHFNDIFSVTESAFCNVPAIGDIVELTSGTKLNPVKTATGATIVGRIIDTNIAGGYLYYVIKVVAEDGNNEATIESLKELAASLGGDASECTTVTEALNVISAALGGSGEAQTNAEAIEDIAQAAPGMMKNDVVWAADTLTLSDMTALTAVRIPDGVTEIGGFGGCSKLETIAIPDSVKTIASGCFGGCGSLTEFSANGLTEARGLFGGCSSLKTVSLPNVVTMNGDFGGCTALESVYLPKAETFNMTVFGSCIALEKIELPSAKYFADQCFGGCSILTALILSGGNVVETGGDPLSGTAIENGTGYIYVPTTLVGAYKTAEIWSKYASQVRAIEDYPDICG